MPKIATKFMADVSVKVGRQRLDVKIPVDLSDLGEDPSAAMLDKARTKVASDMRISVENLPALKKAHRAYRSASR